MADIARGHQPADPLFVFPSGVVVEGRRRTNEDATGFADGDRVACAVENPDRAPTDWLPCSAWCCSEVDRCRNGGLPDLG
jgi:hypothetical protein